MSDAQNTRPAAMSRKLRILLIVSLALNLLVLGAVAGAIGNHWRGGPHSSRANTHAAPHIRALDPSDRRAIGRAIRKARKSTDASVGRIEVYTDMAEAIRATPFNRAAVKALLDRQRQLGTARQDRAESIWLDRMEAMTASDREAYADRLIKVLSRRRHRRGD